MVAHVHSRCLGTEKPYPVNRIPNADASPSELGVRLRELPRALQSNFPLRPNLVELRQVAEAGAPAEVVHDEAPDARSFGGIDHRGLGLDAGGADDADHGILAEECRRKLLGCVVCPDDGDPVWEG